MRSQSGLGVCREWFHLMHDIKHSMCKLQIVWNVDDCGVPLHVHFRRGVALVIRLLGMAHLVVGSPFKV